MAKTEGQIGIEIKSIKTNCKEITKHLDTLEKEKIFEKEYLEKYRNIINDFSAILNGADSLEVRAKNYFKVQKENAKKK